MDNLKCTLAFHRAHSRSRLRYYFGWRHFSTLLPLVDPSALRTFEHVRVYSVRQTVLMPFLYLPRTTLLPSLIIDLQCSLLWRGRDAECEFYEV